uniref:Uncharacterized protein n=1 Tax=Micrurus lemniscatus lemniscatus TaxID=129467 RepID=A0A2D4IR54_MICLE
MRSLKGFFKPFPPPKKGKKYCFLKISHAQKILISFRYDDYDYGEVNQLLERNLKIYIKTVTCYPERTTKRMYDSYWRQFKHSEKVSPSSTLTHILFVSTLENG